MHPMRSAPFVACLVLLCSAGLAVDLISGRSEAAPKRVAFAEFPTRIGPWQGHPSLLDIETERVLGVNDYLLSDYSRVDGKSVNLYVAYYASQRKGESPHSPIVCIPGGGWSITDVREVTLGGGDHSFNRVVIKRRGATQIVYYWFDERGRKIASEIRAKLYLFADAILQNRTDGALVQLTTLVDPSESENDADKRLQAFMLSASPQLSAFLPAASPGVMKTLRISSSGNE